MGADDWGYYNDSNDRLRGSFKTWGIKYPDLTRSLFERAEEDEDEAIGP